MGEVAGIVDEVEGVEAPAGAGARPTVPAPGSAPAAVGSGWPSGGTPASFGEFYADQFTGLVRLAALLSGSADAAPDLVQDCFVRLHGRWATVREPLPYVRRSVVHACASHHRKTAVVRRTPLPEPSDAELGADELEDALAALPARQRAAVVLRYYADLPDADIARALALP